MNSKKKVLLALLVVVLLFAALPTMAFAADYTGYPGGSVTVVIPLKDDTNGQGKITFSGDTDSFTFEVVPQIGNAAMIYNPANGKFSYASAMPIANSAITVKVTVRDSAQLGDSCTIAVSDYLYGLDLESYSPAAKTVEVKAKPTSTPTPTPTKAPTATPTKAPTATPTKAPTATPTKAPTATPTKAPTATPTKAPTATPTKAPTVTPTQAPTKAPTKKPTQGVVTPTQVVATPTPTPEEITPTPEVPGVIDYTELENQINIAESLDEKEYTIESWEALLEELLAGKEALSSTSQDEVDEAAKNLEDAIAGLVKIDYTELIEAIDSANALLSSEELGKLFSQLGGALANGQDALSSRSQATVDAAAAEIKALVEQIKALLEQANQPEEPKDDEPKGDYCNIFIHKLWPILFFISLAGNGVLVFLLVFLKKKGKEDFDDTPVVSYDISEDD